MIQRNDGWLFLSHSTKDFELVRQIRNTLEDHGFRPITFFLKCLTDEEELDSLIYREIAARRWFVYIDSENSRRSKKVNEELDYATELGKKIYTVKTNQDYLPQLREIMRRATVYLSYSHRDRALAQKIRRKLVDNDFQVWADDGLDAGMDWVSNLTDRIREACVDGFIIPIITANFLESRHCAEELYYTLQQNGMVLPIYFGMDELPPGIAFLLSNVQGIRMTTAPSEQELDELIDTLITVDEHISSRK